MLGTTEYAFFHGAQRTDASWFDRRRTAAAKSSGDTESSTLAIREDSR